MGFGNNIYFSLSWIFLSSMSSVSLNILQWKKKLKPNFSTAVNEKRLPLTDPQSCCSEKRLLSDWYLVMLFPACVNSRKCTDHRFLKCSNYAELYSLFYFTLIMWKHNPSSVSYWLWKLFFMPLLLNITNVWNAFFPKVSVYRYSP